MTNEKRARTVRKRRDLYENVAEYLKVFSHPIAVSIVYALSERPNLKRNVGQITDVVNVPRVSVSKMLSKMRMMGIVEADQHGTERFYFLCEKDNTAEQIIKIVEKGS